MKRRGTLVMHIGAPKTGSTALERFLCGNRAPLFEAGHVYPASIERGYGHHDLALLSAGPYPEWATPQALSLDALVDRVRDELDRTAAGKSVILSSENFYWLVQPERAADLAAALGYASGDVRIVVYLRRQEEALASWYNQLVKAQGYTGSFAGCVGEHGDLWDYAARLDRWTTVFGRDQISVRLYPDGAPPFDIRDDFLACLGVPRAGFAFESARTNERLVRDLLEFQRILNGLPLPVVAKRRHHRQLIALSALAPAGMLGDAPLHDRASVEAVERRYRDGNRRVAKAWFDRDALFGPTTVTVGDGTCAPLSPEKLAFVFGWLLTQADPPQETAP